MLLSSCWKLVDSTSAIILCVCLTLIRTSCEIIDKLVLYLQIVPASSIPDGWMGLDIGPDSIKTFNDALDTTKTIIWNGPMGVFEFDKFAEGTEVCKSLFSGVYFLFIILFVTDMCGSYTSSYECILSG